MYVLQRSSDHMYLVLLVLMCSAERNGQLSYLVSFLIFLPQ